MACVQSISSFRLPHKPEGKAQAEYRRSTKRMASTQLNSSQPTTEMEATEGTTGKPSPPVNTKWHESSQNAIVSSNGFATDFITHSMYNARAQAQAAQ
eukprot:scaffold6023_cov150-Skeletonema_marinoi.AAC.1